MAEKQTFDYYFSIADLNSDGKLSQDEALVFFQNFGLQQELVDEILMFTKQEETGLLGRDEFKHALRLVTVAQEEGMLSLKIKRFVAKNLERTRCGVSAAAINAPEFFDDVSFVPNKSMGAAGKDHRPKENIPLAQAQMNWSLFPGPKEIGKDIFENERLQEASLAMLRGAVAMPEVTRSDLFNELKRRDSELRKCKSDKCLMQLDFEEKVKKFEDLNQQLEDNITKYKKYIALQADRLSVICESRGMLQSKFDEKVLEYDELIKERDLAVALAKELHQKRAQDVTYDQLLKERDLALAKVEALNRKRDQMLVVLTSAMHREFSLSALQVATENFSLSRIIGKGGAGCVYRGELPGLTVAVKKLSGQDTLRERSQFEQEVTTLSMVRHPHLIALLGACAESYTLVYEFMPGGSLDYYLDSPHRRRILTWQIRIQIIAEVCSALIFLHKNEGHPIAHGDIKSANVLLDANLRSKLSDFGLSHVLIQCSKDNTNVYKTLNPAGTIGYVDPEYFTNGVLTCRSDVYSYGILIMHLLTAMPVVDPHTNVNIRTPVSEAFRGQNLKSIVDKEGGEWPEEVIFQLARLALSCTKRRGKDRPVLEGEELWKVIKGMWDATKLPSHSYSRSVRDENDEAGRNQRINLGR